MKNLFVRLALAAALASLFISIQTVPAQGTAFTYQGHLQNNGSPANGNYDLQFSLFDASTNGDQVGSTVTNFAVRVTNGQFTTTMDFGPGLFNGDALWLQIGVETNGGGNNFTTLAQRQEVTPTPYAILAGNLAGGGLAAGVYGNAFTFSNAANSFNGSYAGNGSGLTSLNAANLTSGTLADAQLSANVALLDAGQTFSAGLNTFGDLALQNSSAGYHHLVLSGGNSLGYLYGSYPAFGDGIHLGYNYYADADGTGHVINTGGGTSRLSVGYGYISLLTGGVDSAPFSGLTINAGSVNVTTTFTGIGINNSNPQASIDLNGDIIYRGDGLWSAGINSSGNFGFVPSTSGADVAYIDTSGNYHQASDLRLKQGITNLDHTLERLLKMRPVSYHFHGAPTNAPLSLGLIAQEVQPLFPEIVGEQTNGVKDLVYSELVPVTIRSIQELNQKLETQVKQRDAELEDLKQSSEALAKQLNELQAVVKALQEKK
jgi:hypothetical protein